MVRLPRNEKRTYRLKPRPQMWPSGLTLPMTLTLNFQVQIWNLLYLSQKWSDCHETKSKHIYRTPGLKSDQWVSPWLTLTFECWRSNVTLTFDHTHDLDHGSWWSNFEIVVSQNGGPIDIAQGCGSRSFMTMTVTLWWPRSGVWIYHIVTGVTSMVSVPSAHLVASDNSLLPG